MARAQVHALEAIIAALLLLSSVVFALQMTAVTPLSASTSSQHVENQLQASAEGVLSAAAANDELKPAILAVDGQDFHKTENERFFTAGAPPNAFGDRLERAFGDRGIAYNVWLHPVSAGTNGRIILNAPKEYVFRGAPSDNAVSASRTIVLTDNDTLHDASMSPTDTVIDGTNFYAPDASTGPTYNAIRVEVVAWRI